MYYSFDDKLQSYAEQGKTRSAYLLIVVELGKTLGSDKKAFVDLLNNSGIQASMSDSAETLANKYVNNIATNRKLMLGTSLLAQMKNQMSGADGKKELRIILIFLFLYFFFIFSLLRKSSIEIREESLIFFFYILLKLLLLPKIMV